MFLSAATEIVYASWTIKWTLIESDVISDLLPHAVEDTSPFF